MNKTIGQLVLALALVSLVGCGLKGPLYFPPKEQPKTQQKQPTKQTTQSNRTVQTDSDVSGLINSKRAN